MKSIFLRNHFNQELSSNKVVRFIYQGQFLKDSNTIKSYNIRDKTTIHCHITTRQVSNPNNNGNNSTTPTVNIENNNIIEQQQQQHDLRGASSNDQNSSNNNSQENRFINFEVATILLPVSTILLATIWYFRINFKQFFSPLSNLFLFFLTFVYTIFLFTHFYQMFTFTHRLTERALRTVRVQN
jgi:hypothetical protein